MKRLLVPAALLGCSVAAAQVAPPPAQPTLSPPASAPAPPAAPPGAATMGFWDQLASNINAQLGRPYVWGATGPKSYDCSGFIWRVMWDSGILLKRTTARKYYMCLPKVQESSKWNLGTVVFFDDLEHCGLVSDKKTFFHSARTLGTHLTNFDPFWRPKKYGFRAIPVPPALAVPQPPPTPTPTPQPTATVITTPAG